MRKDRSPQIAAILTCLALAPMTASAYWTSYASEETPPAACDTGDAAAAAFCSGSNCDNTYLNCAETNYRVYSRTWSSNFSEEGTYWRTCPSGAIMSGVSCSGNLCDNVSIECSQVSRTPVGCYWTQWHSEESSLLNFPAGYYAAGMACSGGNCDNHMYYICRF